MDVSSFFDGEETSQTKQLNSTAFDLDADQSKENEEKEWKLSPIVADRTKSSIFNNRENLGSENCFPSSSSGRSFKSPLKVQNKSEVSGYESKSTVDEVVEEETDLNSVVLSSPQPGSSKTSSVTSTANVSSFQSNKSLNTFDSLFINSLHKSINFSPRIVFSTESVTRGSDDGEFGWSVEQMAILRPAIISDEEIAASNSSPGPEEKIKIQEQLDEYWANNVVYIPSPDGPRHVHLPDRDGNVTTYTYEGSTFVKKSTSSDHREATPSLSKLVRQKEAMKATYATSSPKQRPRKNIRRMQNRCSQTEITIPPALDLDLKKLLGDAFVYQEAEEDDEEEEVYDVSMCSNMSTRRRLFQDEEQDGNTSVLSTDNLDESQPFNDSLSPVRRPTNEEDPNEDEDGEIPNVSNPQGTVMGLSISILNGCMLESMHEMEQTTEKDDDNETEDENRVFNDDTHLHQNEYEIMDESTTSHAHHRIEDLDCTPRRSNNRSIDGPSSELKRFVFDMSPIHPKFTPKRPNGGGNL